MKHNYFCLDRKAVARVLRTQELKHAWVAEMAGVHKTTLRRWVHGRIRRVREEHAIRLAGVLNVPVDSVVHSNA